MSDELQVGDVIEWMSFGDMKVRARINGVGTSVIGFVNVCWYDENIRRWRPQFDLLSPVIQFNQETPYKIIGHVRADGTVDTQGAA